MRHYLIDYENLHENAFKLLTDITPEDKFYLFYTNNASKINMDVLSDFGGAIRFFKAPAGKQSLDMNLVTYLGFLFKSFGPNDEYIIVSKDCDYDNIKNYWKNNGYNKIKRIYPETAEASKDEIQLDDKTVLNNKIQLLLSENQVQGNTPGAIASIVSKFYGENKYKQSIYREIIKKFGQKEGLKYYTVIKKYL